MVIPLQQQTPIAEMDSAVREPDHMDDLAERFSALADATRLRIVHLLMTNGEMCVCEFMPLLGLTQSNVSFHLKALKYAGFITSRKEGRWMLYRLNRKAFGDFMAEFESVFNLSLWPEEPESAPRTEAIRRRLACSQQPNPLSCRGTTGEGGNDNANE